MELITFLIFSLRSSDYVIKWRPLALNAPLHPIIENWEENGAKRDGCSGGVLLWAWRLRGGHKRLFCKDDSKQGHKSRSNLNKISSAGYSLKPQMCFAGVLPKDPCKELHEHDYTCALVEFRHLNTQYSQMMSSEDTITLRFVCLCDKTFLASNETNIKIRHQMLFHIHTLFFFFFTYSLIRYFMI